jgi:hypothetical protein
VIVGAAVCPGAPFLIDGTADPIAARLQPVTLAAADAVARLPPADLTLLLTGSNRPGVGRERGGIGWRVLPPGTHIPTTALRRSDVPDPHALTLTATTANLTAVPVSDPAVGTMVGAYLLDAAVRRRADPVPSDVLLDRPQPAGQPADGTESIAVEIGRDPAGAARALAARLNAARRVAVLVIADGAACHGDAAPGRRDDRAEAFDTALARALASGDPAALHAATTDRALAGELMASVEPLAVLALLTAERPPDAAELLYSAAPLGVGYLVASWGWAQS